MFPTDVPSPPVDPAEGPPDGSRAGATWVAATGAFLLVAAAAVFIAVRWDTLPEPAKLALVGALTGAFLVGGRALRRTLPATGEVLFHLGAFLLPVDVAGLCVRANVGWRNLVLAEGIAGVAALGTLGTTTGSVVLATAAASSVVVLAVGVAATTILPAPLVLAGAALAAHLARRRREAIAWATIAGVAPVLAAGVGNTLAALSRRDLGGGTLAELGLAGGGTAAAVALASGIVCAAVLAREAHERKDLGLVAIAATSLVCGASTAWVSADPSTDVGLLTAPAVFVALELVALAVVRDAFWRRPARWVATTGEVIAALAAPVTLAYVLIAPAVEEGIDLFGDNPPWEPEPVGATALGLLAAGWLLAGWRRQSPKPSIVEAVRAAVADDRTVVFAFLAAVAGVVVGSASTAVIAAALIAAAVGLAATRGALATSLAIAAAGWAPVVLAPTHEALVLPVGLVAAAALAHATRRHTSAAVIVPIAAASVTIAVSASLFGRHHYGTTGALLAAVVSAWLIALVVERPSTIAAHLVRVSWLVVTAATVAATPGEALPVLLATTALSLFDAARTDDSRVACAAALTGPGAIFAASALADVTQAESGVVLAGAAAVLYGFAALTPASWRLPLLSAAATSISVGLVLSSTDTPRFAEAIVVTGGVLIAGGVTLRNAVLAHAGAVVATFGIAVHLSFDGVTATEPFLLPVALQLLVIGAQLRRGDKDVPSSWMAFGPSIVLLGGAALAERLADGAPWHALVAGAVGVVAVAAGGWRRLAGPLLLGTALLTTVTVVETLHTLAGVPTWAWLAAGGTTLLLVGVGLERSATSPSEAGRRLVDVVAERFE
ncbi:MAG TPA: DUF2157 domain-containing protein [Acidimicrobiales bacterium]|nr:DUF2157 domain-containing protein [Acidimicrobiales bacterium]